MSDRMTDGSQRLPVWPGVLLAVGWLGAMTLAGLSLARGPVKPPAADGRTAATAIAAGPGTTLSELSKVSPHLPIARAVLWWNATIDPGHGRCYVSFDLPTVQRTAFVTVPDDWCEGMR